MATVQKGTKGAVFGIPGTVTLTNDTDTFTVLRSYNYAREADTKDIVSAIGELICRAFYNERETVSVDILVMGSSKENAAEAFSRLPTVGDYVTIASDSDTQIPGTEPDNEWRVQTASKVATQDDFGTMTLGLIRYANDLDDVAVTTP